MINLKEKIQSGGKLIGTHITVGESCIAELLGYIGFDFLWVDMEHTNFSLHNLYDILNAAKLAGTRTIVRIPQHDYTYLKKILEMGPDGIIFPMITDVQQAREDIAHSLYPPFGVRGFGPKRAIRYGLDDTLEYIRSSSESMCRFVQLEHVSMLKQLEDYLDIPFIDGFIIGPCDLAGSIGKLGYQLEEETTNLIRQSIDIFKKHNKYVGISYGDYSVETIKHWSDLGFDMISVGSEMDYILYGAQAALANLQHAHLNNKP